MKHAVKQIGKAISFPEIFDFPVESVLLSVEYKCHVGVVRISKTAKPRSKDRSENTVENGFSP